ncbi:MAG: hypothetical protein MUF38_11270 [Anaerolineae bacterium]|nr:hypothetical protein [Anaerolineae bacterium]
MVKQALGFRWWVVLLVAFIAFPAVAHDDGVPVHTDESEGVTAEADIVYAQVVSIGGNLIFQMVVVGEAGANIPEPTGDLAGAPVVSYVWPTSLDSAAVGFEPGQGILALAVTSHPDFDDTPLWDEDGDDDPANDGAVWHSHWVVLVEDEACAAGLKVQDIEEGSEPALPATWPGLPLLIDSPGYAVELYGSEVVVSVPRSALSEADSFSFDGVTAGLQVNADLHSPLLCVTGVDDIASGDLSLPGVMGR